MREETSQSEYLNQLFPETPLMAKSHVEAEQLNKKPISIAAAEGKLISFLIHMHGCQKFVEVGTLTGYSALWILEGLSGSKQLWTLEKEESHAKAAQRVFDQHVLKSNIKLLVGDAIANLETLSSQAPFDGVFIDANKAAYGKYLDWAEKNIRKGGLILADNVFLSGSVFGADKSGRFSDKQVEIMREFNRRLSDNSKYDSCILPSNDGIFAAVKRF